MLDYYSSHYEYKVIFGDFNLNPFLPVMNTFLNTENLTNLIKKIKVLKGQVHVLININKSQIFLSVFFVLKDWFE